MQEDKISQDEPLEAVQPIEPEFKIIKHQRTPKAPSLDEPVPVWLKTNKILLTGFMAFIKKLDNALGVAANQTAWRGKRIDKRFFVHRTGKGMSFPLKLVIDPVIVERYGEQVSEVEGCLSWPARQILVKRHLKITVSYWTQDGERVENETLNRFNSQVWQHEMDHLDGVEEKFSEAYKPYVRGEKKIGRNEPCPCGSGKKLKKCCEGS